MAKPLLMLRMIYASHFPLGSESLACYVKGAIHGAAGTNDIDEPRGDVVRLRLKRWSRRLAKFWSSATPWPNGARYRAMR